ncbi:PIG-L family deacetylase [Nocardioides sp. W7]|uniref:PIG-L family deacetylase n=1 Tax=Nocardioides sp. W7 TaxID=2931390 RepID=UPI001FD1C02D|nr:PIG-L family deacetylase [Nocardioides sp. W7]
MTTISLTGPVDDAGRLLHEDDLVAQLALSLARLEDTLAARGREPADLATLRVLAVDPVAAAGVRDVLTERLEATGADPAIEVVPGDLPLPGMQVAIEAELWARLLVVVAHPDDEAFGTGSVLAHASAHGARTVVVCATRGDLGEPAPGSGLSRSDLPAVREQELRSACALLGVERVEVLGYVDSGVDGDPAPGSLAAADPAELRARVTAYLDEVRPDVVVTLDASDGHRDHAAVRDAVIAGLDHATERPAATYLSCLSRVLMREFTGAELGTPDEAITTIVDVADLLDLRWQAIRTHASQVPPFDAMDKELQLGFLATDRLLRVDPAWGGGPVERDWLPRTNPRTNPNRTPHPSSSTSHPDQTQGTRMSIATPSSPAATLRGACEVHLPGDPGYDVARQAWNLAVDQRPAAVAIPTSVAEVVAVVRAAVSAGLRVAPQSTGHGASALAEQDLSEVVIVRLSSLTGVSVDAPSRTASVVGGTLWQDVVAAAAPYGLTALHGSAPDVAVAGYALSGGLSFYGRRHGVAANSVRAVEVVTADGSLVRADAAEHADLYWAVRGGGGNLGVVVGMELELLPYANVYAGMLLWDVERAPEVVRAWAAWTREAPESATTSLRVMSFPPLPELPPFLSGRSLMIIDGAVLEDDQQAAEVLAPLRALDPELDTFGRIPSAAMLEVHMDPPAPTPAVSDHSVLGELTDAAIDAFLGQVGPGTASGLMFAELRHLGGAFARPVEGGGAVSHVPGSYALYCVAIAPFPEAAVAGRAAAQAVVAAMAPWSQASLVPTFAESAVDTSTFFDGEDWARLAHLRTQLDPARRMVANHRV